MATKLEVIMTNQGEEGFPYECFYGRMPEYARSLHTFREILVATNPAIRGQPKAKLMDHSDVSMFLGYTKDHVEDVYQFLKLKINKVIHSQDATWMGQTWGEFYKVKPDHQVVQVDDNEVEEPKVKIEELNVDELEETETITEYKAEPEKGGTEQKIEMPLCLQHELRNLDTFYNQTLPK